MALKKPLLICIVGPTAIGKTALSIEVAKAFATEIISADSRQFYKEMRIGTAVPSQKELEEVQHHFIQNRSVLDSYSVGDFEKEVLENLTDLFKKQAIVVLVGGSGLYVDAVTKGLNKFPEIKRNIRETLNKEFSTNGIEFLQKELQETDPEYYKKVDLKNHHRIIRALEVCRSSEKPYSSFLNAKKPERFFNTLFIGLTADRDIIYDRINQRVDIMLQEGLVQEVENLLVHKNLNALQTVGYRELFQYFDGIFTKEQAIEEIKKNTRRFAKRQITWFKKNKEINWFDYATKPEEVIAFIKNKI